MHHACFTPGANTIEWLIQNPKSRCASVSARNNNEGATVPGVLSTAHTLEQREGKGPSFESGSDVTHATTSHATEVYNQIQLRI